jgi:hypothetical protein
MTVRIYSRNQNIISLLYYIIWLLGLAQEMRVNIVHLNSSIEFTSQVLSSNFTRKKNILCSISEVHISYYI